MALTGALPIVSAMITPALLILACASLIGASGQRMARLVDRVRYLRQDFAQLMGEKTATMTDEDIEDFFHQIRRNVTRAQRVQIALILLYLSLSFLVATGVALGVQAFYSAIAWLAVALGLVAVILLLSAGIVLISEARLGLAAVKAEMMSSLRIAEKAQRKRSG